MSLRIDDQANDPNEPVYVVFATESGGELLWTFSRAFIARETVDRIWRFIESFLGGTKNDGTIFILPTRDGLKAWKVLKSNRGALETKGATLPTYRSPGE